MMVNTKSSDRFALWPLPDLAGSVVAEDMSGATVEMNEFEKGFAAGYEKATAENSDSAETLFAALRDATKRYDEMTEQLGSEMQQYAAELSLAIAREIIKREATVDESLVVNTVKRILDTVGENGEVQIRLHPEDLAGSESYRILDEWPSRHEWVADPTLERGGCTIESPGRFIDGSVDTILNDFARRLANV